MWFKAFIVAVGLTALPVGPSFAATSDTSQAADEQPGSSGQLSEATDDDSGHRENSPESGNTTDEPNNMPSESSSPAAPDPSETPTEPEDSPGPSTGSLNPPRNILPTAQPVSAGTVAPGASITFSLFGEDPDGDLLVYTLESAPPASQGTARVSQDGKATFTASSNYAGPVSFAYVVDDDEASSAPATVTVMVEKAVVSAPAISGGSGNEPRPMPSPNTLGTLDSATASPQSSESSHSTSVPIAVPTQVTVGVNGLEGSGVDGRDLAMGAVVAAASGMLVLGIRKLGVSQK